MTFAYLPWMSERDRSAPAVRDDTITLTYEQLDDWSAAVADQLAAQGFGEGSVLAVMLPNRVELVVAILAAWRLGGIATPVNPAFTAAEADFQINDCDAHLVINESRGSPSAGRPAIHVDELVGPGPGPQPATLTKDHVALLIYTSGSTGKPKGVMLDHANIDAMTAGFVEHMELTPQDHSLLILPLFHVNALMLGTLSPFRVGAQTSIVGKFSVSRFFEQVEKLRPTYFSAVPSILSMLVALPDDVQPDTSSLRFAGCGAAPLSEELMTCAQDRFGIVVVEGYGLTEATCGSAVNPLSGPRKLGTVGPAMSGQRIEIMSPTGEILPRGERGEVVISGPVVMRGYLNLPEVTAQTIVDGWLHTGDVGILDDDGYLRIVGRIKDMIIRGGENIYPKEIESILTAFDGVLDAAVVGRPHEILGEVPVAYVQAYPGAALDIDSLAAHCRRNLAKVKVPEVITLVEELPKNPVGKPDKPALRRIAANAVSAVATN
jgi:long-chain acyl-CoA synthetase